MLSLEITVTKKLARKVYSEEEIGWYRAAEEREKKKEDEIVELHVDMPFAIVTCFI